MVLHVCSCMDTHAVDGIDHAESKSTAPYIELRNGMIEQ